MTRAWLLSSVAACVVFAAGSAPAQNKLLFSEIMYHPVEKEAFDANGAPLLDLSQDIHEFIELHNAGTNLVSLDGWRVRGGIAFDFPAGISVAPGGFLVIAKDPVRLAAIAQYSLTTNQLLGPWSGQLGNGGDTVRLRDAADAVVDAVSYSASFPWAIGADALGSGDEWTGLNSYNFQFRGRSLERVSFVTSANDPANWLASPLVTGPTPRRTNSVQLPKPRPVVTAFSAVQAIDGAALIGPSQAVRVDVLFSATNQLSAVAVEYFVDDINATNEPHFTIALAALTSPGDGRYFGTLPGQASRSIVRYRIRADRGTGSEAVSPRADDPFGWHAYFVTPVRAAGNPSYDCFISTVSLNSLSTNISQSPRRVVLPDPPGTTRASWDATEPAVFVYNGAVFDIRMRHHGSRYNRNVGRNSFKWQFPGYHPFEGGRGSVFITDKGDEHRVGTQFYDAANLPAWRCQYVNLYLNNNAVLQRLQQEEMDDTLYKRWTQEQAARFPGQSEEGLGGFFKATGVIPFETGTGQGTATYLNSGEGPYYIGNCSVPPAKTGWTTRQRCDWTYTPQINGWKGGADVEQLLTGLWAARGDSPLAPNPNIPALRSFLATNFDVDRTLTYIAIRDWSAPFDNATHNYFIWRRANGLWAMTAWDLDVEFGNASKSIFWDEQVPAQPDTLRGPHWLKDSFYKAYREEYKQKLWLLNNTLLNPAGFAANGWSSLQAFASSRLASVNQQLALGVFQRPAQPVNLMPVATTSAFPPATLTASAYGHSDPNPPAHALTTWIIRRANGGYTNPAVRVTSTNLTTFPIPFDKLDFGQTYYWKCFYTDTNGHPSLESVETAFVYGGATPGSVRLSEIMADNRITLTNGGYTPDFIELVNVSGTPQPLDGVSLSDDPARPGKFVFPSGLVIPSQSFLTVWCDAHTNAPGLHTGFALDNDGQTVALFVVTAGGYLLTDTVTFGPQIADKSIGRIGTGPGVPPPWVLTDPTPGAANLASTLGSPGLLKVNEWLASATAGPDWFELFNTDTLPVALEGLYLSDSAMNRTNTRIAPLCFIAPRGFRQFIADQNPGQGPRHVDFKLSAGGESILLSAANVAPIDTINFGAQATDISEGRLPDGAAGIATFPGSASPEAPNRLFIGTIAINEIEPDIELRNLTDAPVNISGWWLSDDSAALKKFQIPGGNTVPPGGYWRQDASALPFQLDPERGGRVFLSHDDVFQTSAKYGPYDGHPYGALPTSIGIQFTRLSAPTFGATNSPPEVGPVVISEIQYHPPDLPGDDDDYEFIELANISGAPAGLFLAGYPAVPWRIRDAVAFRFPTNTTLAIAERVLVVPFDPATNAPALSNFLAVYDVPPGVRFFGPCAGHIANAGASVELVQDRLPLTTPGPDYGVVPVVLMDRVNFSDTFPWPPAADGTGSSLQRRSLAGYGNEPTNWFASGATPGALNASNTPPAIALSLPLQGSMFAFHQPITLTATATDSDADGSIRRVEFFADDILIGLSPGPSSFTMTWSNAPAGLHSLTARATDNRLGSTLSAAIQVNVINQPPSVALTAPANGSSYALPTNILISATAGDTDGSVVLVEFFDTGVKLGQSTAPPYNYLWTNVASGTRVLTVRATDDGGGTAISAAVNITAARPTNTAYIVPAGTVGTQTLPNPYSIGMDFEVVSPILITRLGCFDSASDGINASSTLTTQIYDRNGPTPAVVASASFSSIDPGALVGGSRFKALASTVLLTNGSYSCAGYGYDGNNRNGNIGTGNAKVWTTDDSGALGFTGGGRYGPNSPGGFPTTLDGGPADRYAAGTFEFKTVPPTPLIVSAPTNMFVRPATSVTNSVTATGTAPLRYQWTLNNSTLPGATNSLLIITNAQAASEGNYRVTVTNTFGSATSAPASLALLVDPIIVQSPLSQNVVAGGSITLSVSVTNTATLPMGYRIRRNGTTLPTTVPGAYVTLNERTAYFTISGTNAAPPWTSYAIICTNIAKPSGNLSAVATLTYVTDTDGDGLPDEWESQYFGSATGANPNIDSDGDGMLNWQEYVAGTDPTNPASYLKIDSIAAGPATLMFGALSNKTYTVQFTETLGSGPWTRLIDIAARPTNRIEIIVDPVAAAHRTYRIATPQQP